MTIHTLTLLGLFLVATGPVADEPAGAAKAPRPAAEATSAEAGAALEVGFKVAVDPVTGEIIAQPTERDLEILAEGVRSVRRRSSWELRSFPLQNGGVGVFLDGWADQSLEVRVDEDGRLHMTCGETHSHGPEASGPASENRDGETLR